MTSRFKEKIANSIPTLNETNVFDRAIEICN